MFGFLKDKLKAAVSVFSKKVDEEGEEKQVEVDKKVEKKNEEKEEKKEISKKEVKKPAEKTKEEKKTEENVEEKPSKKEVAEETKEKKWEKKEEEAKEEKKGFFSKLKDKFFGKKEENAEEVQEENIAETEEAKEEKKDDKKAAEKKAKKEPKEEVEEKIRKAIEETKEKNEEAIEKKDEEISEKQEIEETEESKESEKEEQTDKPEFKEPAEITPEIKESIKKLEEETAEEEKLEEEIIEEEKDLVKIEKSFDKEEAKEIEKTLREEAKKISEEKKEIERERVEAKKLAETSEEEPKKKGFFSFIKETITTKKISEDKFNELFWEIEVALLENSVAVEVIEKIKEDLKASIVDKAIPRKDIDTVVAKSLIKSIEDLFDQPNVDLIERIEEKNKTGKPYVICFVGINGSGKTTTIAKVAHMLQKKGLSCIIAASDTFRAAAIDQLQVHADKLGVKLVKHDYNADPAAVAFDAIKHAESKNKNVVLIDTAGRLHSNSNLMEELQKVVRVAKPDFTIFTGEAITGNDCIEQAREFDKMVSIDGIILSKADVDQKGGAAISISYVLKKPILYLGVGQNYEDLRRFTPDFITEQLSI